MSFQRSFQNRLAFRVSSMGHGSFQAMIQSQFLDQVPSLTVDTGCKILHMNSSAKNCLDPQPHILQDLFPAADVQWGAVNRVRTRRGLEPLFVMRQHLDQGRFQSSYFHQIARSLHNINCRPISKLCLFP